jgi:hypothetical protein
VLFSVRMARPASRLLLGSRDWCDLPGQREVLQYQVTTRQLREEHLVDRADS